MKKLLNNCSTEIERGALDHRSMTIYEKSIAQYKKIRVLGKTRILVGYTRTDGTET